MWVCQTCGVEHAEASGVCVICADERQWVPAGGQKWATLDELAQAGRRVQIAEVEPDLFGITVEPKVGIGQTDASRAHARRQPPVGPGRVSRRGGREPRAGAGRGGGDRRQPSAHVRRPGRVEQGARGCAGARLGGRLFMGSASGSRDQDLERTVRGRARPDPAPGRRPLPRKLGRPLAGRCRRQGRAARLGHDPRQSRSGDGDVPAQLPEPDPAVARRRAAHHGEPSLSSRSTGCTTTSAGPSRPAPLRP